MEQNEITQIEQDLEIKDTKLEVDPKDIPTLVVTEPPKYGTIELSDQIKERAKKAIMQRFNSVKDQHDEFVKKCDLWDRMYRAGTPEQNKDTVAQVASMIVFNSVEDWVATMMDAHFSVDPPLQVRSKRGKDNEVTLKRITNVLWNNALETHIEENAEQLFRAGIKYGTFVAKTPYTLDEDLGFKIVKTPSKWKLGGFEFSVPFITQKNIVEEIRIEDRVPLQYIDIRNLFFRYERKSWIIEWVKTSWSIIEKQAEQGIYANIEKAKKTSSGENYPKKELVEQAKADSTPQVEDLDQDVDILEGHHIPLKFEKDDNVPEELKGQTVLCLIAIANQQEVIRVLPETTKEPPYLICPMIQQDGSELGIGIPQIIEVLVKEMNTRKNQSLDANTFGLYCMVVANMKYIKKPEQLKIRPNGAIELKGVPQGARVEDIVSFIRPPVEFVQVAVNLMDRLQNEIVTTTRLKGVSSGEKLSPNPSATEMTSIMKEAIKSIKIIFRRVDRNIFEPYFERVYVYFVLNRQKSWTIATTETQTNPQTGAPMQVPVWEEVTPQQIYSDGIEIRMLGTTHMEDEIVTRHQNMQLLDIATKYGSIPMKNELGQPVVPNFYNLLNDVYYTFGKEDVARMWEVLPPPPPPAPPTPPSPQGEMMQGGPAGMNLGSPPPTPASITQGAVNPRAIRQPIGGMR